MGLTAAPSTPVVLVGLDATHAYRIAEFIGATNALYPYFGASGLLDQTEHHLRRAHLPREGGKAPPARARSPADTHRVSPRLSFSDRHVAATIQPMER